MCFQDVDYAMKKPVRYTKLTHSIYGLCVSGSWLVVADKSANTTSLYSLPDLALHHQVTVEYCMQPRVDTTGLVYVPAWRPSGCDYIAILQITSGRMTELRNLTTVRGDCLYYPVVAVGPQPGQLCVGQDFPPRLSIVNVTDGSLILTVTLPDPCILWAVAALDSGQLMISYYISYPDNHSLAFYTSVTDSPTVLYNMSAVGDGVEALLGHGQHFLVPYVFKADLLVVDSGGAVLHTVDAVSGKLGVYLYGIQDVAVWQDCVWLGGVHGDLVLLCAD